MTTNTSQDAENLGITFSFCETDHSQQKKKAANKDHNSLGVEIVL